MRNLTIIACISMLFGAISVAGCGGSDAGPKIEVGLNIRNLCGYFVAGEVEKRCENQTACENDSSRDDDFCITLDNTGGELGFDPVQGYCRQCETNANCTTAGEGCDHGYCHIICTADADCAGSKLCYGGFCRPPHFTDFTFSNSGDRDLEIYPNETELRGENDACAFSLAHLEWETTDDPIVLPPDDTILLRVKFLPSDVGTFRGVLRIHSNSEKGEGGILNPLHLLMCGQTSAALCDTQTDGTCETCSCASSGEVDFNQLVEQTPTCE